MKTIEAGLSSSRTARQDSSPRLTVHNGRRKTTARFLPAADKNGVPLVALHGISRDAKAIWSAFQPNAAALGRALLVPLLDRKNWPHFQRIDAFRPDLAVLDLLRRAGLAHCKIELFGYSGGAQLAHRFAMLYPHKVARLHIAAPGWFCLPNMDVVWPEGLGDAEQGTSGSPRTTLIGPCQVQLPAYLSLPVRIWVGANDTERDAALRKSAELDRLQGINRLERATTYVEEFRKAAERLQIKPDIELCVLPGAGHDFVECARIGGLADKITNQPLNHGEYRDHR
jgi:pimeloyl-ACP methyl ester carboxylesterase